MAKYKVQSGDSLPKIAAKFGTTVGQLRQTNNIFSVSRGQEIKVPQWSNRAHLPNPVTPPQPWPQSPQMQYLSQFPGQGTMPKQNLFSSLYSDYRAPAAPAAPAPLNTTWPPRPQVTPNTRNMYLSQFPGQGAATNARADYMAQFPGQGTITNEVRRNEFLSSFPGQGTIATQPVAQTTTQAAMPVYNPAYPPAVRPTGAITPDTWSQWAAYWNYEATKPASARIPSPPQVMTKDQIWEMKKRKAVERKAALAADQASQFTPVYTGSSVQNLALRTG